MKLNIVAGAVLTCVLCCSAVKASPMSGKTMHVSQPDGTTLEMKAWGDEFCHFLETVDGYTVVRDEATGVWQYAVLSADGSQLLPSGVVVGTADPAALDMVQHLRTSGKTQSALRIAGRLRARGGARQSEVYTTTGTRTGITIVVNFPDESTSITTTQISDLLNKKGYSEFGNTGSVNDYFTTMSAGRLNFTNIVIGPYMAQYNKSHYDANEEASELVAEALQWAENTNGFDFSQCDGDGDGLIDAISVFFAGGMGEKGLWPHQYSVQFSADGKYAKYYQVSNIGDKLTTYTFCHECMHMLANVDDLYDTKNASYGMGYYCVMSQAPSDESKPQKVCGYLRYRAGWVEPTDITSVTSGTYQLDATVGNLLKYSKSSTEYFIIENRQEAGWDVMLTSSGISVLHCDSEGHNYYPSGTASEHYECALMQADGRKDLENMTNPGDTTDLFDATTALFNDTTTPKATWWDGSASGLKMTVSGAKANLMTVTIGTAGTTDGGTTDGGTTDGGTTDGGTTDGGTTDGGTTDGGTTDGGTTGALTGALSLSQTSYTVGETLTLKVSISGQSASPVDLYCALYLPTGNWMSFNSNLQLLDGVRPVLQGWTPTTVSDFEMLRLALPAVPEGLYQWYLVAVPAGANPGVESNWVMSNSASCTISN